MLVARYKLQHKAPARGGDKRDTRGEFAFRAEGIRIERVQQGI
jgi:hypothetical protein